MFDWCYMISSADLADDIEDTHQGEITFKPAT
jgi:hypothetical protein